MRQKQTNDPKKDNRGGRGTTQLKCNAGHITGGLLCYCC